MSKLDKYAEQQDLENQRYFFDQESGDDWFLIPVELKPKWQELTNSDIPDDAYELQDEFEREFGGFRTGGGISQISFTSPKDIK